MNIQENREMNAPETTEPKGRFCLKLGTLSPGILLFGIILYVYLVYSIVIFSLKNALILNADLSFSSNDGPLYL